VLGFSERKKLEKTQTKKKEQTKNKKQNKTKQQCYQFFRVRRYSSQGIAENVLI